MQFSSLRKRDQAQKKDDDFVSKPKRRFELVSISLQPPLDQTQRKQIYRCL